MANHKRILKNTGFMAARMLASMAVTLITSRVILQQLGVTDFGVYSVVAGLTMIMAFFTSAMTTAIQRYMNVELAVTHGSKMQSVFSACWATVFAVSFIFLIFAEVVGLWFLNNELNIPPNRLSDAHTVFQLSLVIVLIEMVRVPYNSLIIAHERMSFYAYNAILEVSLKLATAILLIFVGSDKLIMYMIFLVCVAFIINLSYILYCKKILPDIHFSVKADRKQIIQIGKFAGWNAITSISDISYQQGTSMILNIFFGVSFNASMGIANQVKSAITSFTRSLQTAANPQIIQTFSSDAIDDFTLLFLRISRISFYCVALLGIPILLNTEYVLRLWLTIIPPEGVSFVRLVILFCLVDSLTGPLWVTMQASGKIAVYQIVISVVWLLSLPLTYIAYKFGFPAYSLLTVIIAIDALLIFFRVIFTQQKCGVPASVYFKEVIWNIIKTLVPAIVFPVMLIYFVEMHDIVKLLVSTAIWAICYVLSIYWLGLTDGERGMLQNAITKHLKR